MSNPKQVHTHTHTHLHGISPTHATHRHTKPEQGLSVLGWPAWLRVLAVSPVVMALWLAVTWANMGLPAW